jgi:hypothetical protein
VTLISFSCLTKSKTDLQTELQSKHKDDSTDICYWHDIKRELTPDNNYLDFKKVTTDKYFLEWGNKNLTRVLLDTFYCESPPTSRPTFENENEKYIVLRFGCGSPCWGAIFLPLNENQEPETILYQYDIDLERDLVVYLDSNEDDPTIAIYNLLTKKKVKHKVDFGCESAIPTYCLDSISINGDKVFYRWTSNFQTNKQDERTIEIE